MNMQDISLVTPHRTMDATFLNLVANDGAVRPHLGSIGAPIDLTEAIANPDNIAFVGRSGGFFVEKRDAFGLYEGHSMFLPGDTAERPVQVLEALLQYLFIETDCVELLTKIPFCNKAAMGLGRSAGFRTMFEREAAWDVPGGGKCAVAFSSLPFIRWVAMTLTIEQYGEWFHDRLEHLAGIKKHTEEPLHNRMVGAAVLMFRAKNSLKAMALYNRWASFAGYAPIRVISEHPLVIDVGDAIVQIRGDNMEVLRCP